MENIEKKLNEIGIEITEVDKLSPDLEYIYYGVKIKDQKQICAAKKIIEDILKQEGYTAKRNRYSINTESSENAKFKEFCYRTTDKEIEEKVRIKNYNLMVGFLKGLGMNILNEPIEEK